MTIRFYTQYVRSTGGVVGQGGVPYNHFDELSNETHIAFEGEYARTHWYNQATDSLEPLTDLPVSIDFSEITVGQSATLSGIPVGTIASTRYGPVTVDDGILVMTGGTAGRFSVMLTHPQHFQETYVVDVND